jgi:hypothetical protein
MDGNRSEANGSDFGHSMVDAIATVQ